MRQQRKRKTHIPARVIAECTISCPIPPNGYSAADMDDRALKATTHRRGGCTRDIATPCVRRRKIDIIRSIARHDAGRMHTTKQAHATQCPPSARPSLPSIACDKAESSHVRSKKEDRAQGRYRICHGTRRGKGKRSIHTLPPSRERRKPALVASGQSARDATHKQATHRAALPTVACQLMYIPCGQQGTQ